MTVNNIRCLTLGPLATNCYIVSGENGGAAVVVDPADDPEAILETLKREGLTVGAIVCTHGHYDHVGAVARIAEVSSAPVYMDARDAEMLADPQANLSAAFGEGAVVPSVSTRAVREGDFIESGGQRVKVLETPGHTRGGISLVGPGYVICGDALFAGSIGRTDLPGGDFETLMRSIKTKLLTLPDDTVVYPGHGPSTMVGVEKETNPFF